ncbi:MAG TPA: hypothetical protein VIW23_11860 [Candidatus Acidoferrum sp.]
MDILKLSCARRYRAVQPAGLKEIPVRIGAFTDAEAFEIHRRTGLREGSLAARYSDQRGSAVFPHLRQDARYGSTAGTDAVCRQIRRASGIVFERTGTHAIVITEIKEMKDVTVKDEE